MLLINESHPFHRDISLLQWCDVWLWQPLDINCKTYHDSLSLKLQICWCCCQYFWGLMFLSPLFLADFDTLNYIFWYISDAVLLSSFNIFSMVFVIVIWFCSCFLNMLLFFLHYYSDVMCDCGSLWIVILKPIMIVYP